MQSIEQLPVIRMKNDYILLCEEQEQRNLERKALTRRNVSDWNGVCNASAAAGNAGLDVEMPQSRDIRQQGSLTLY